MRARTGWDDPPVWTPKGISSPCHSNDGAPHDKALGFAWARSGHPHFCCKPQFRQLPSDRLFFFFTSKQQAPREQLVHSFWPPTTINYRRLSLNCTKHRSAHSFTFGSVRFFGCFLTPTRKLFTSQNNRCPPWRPKATPAHAHPSTGSSICWQTSKRPKSPIFWTTSTTPPLATYP